MCITCWANSIGKHERTSLEARAHEPADMDRDIGGENIAEEREKCPIFATN